MSKHTQWEACSNLVRTKPTANDHGGIEGGFLVCECPANTQDAIDNARLIAAAPDLLEALEFILRGMDGGNIKCAPYFEFDPDVTQLEFKHPAELLRAAIAKAKGEQQ